MGLRYSFAAHNFLCRGNFIPLGDDDEVRLRLGQRLGSGRLGLGGDDAVVRRERLSAVDGDRTRLHPHAARADDAAVHQGLDAGHRGGRSGDVRVGGHRGGEDAPEASTTTPARA